MSVFLRILRDPIWQAIGALIGVVAIFVTLSTAPPNGGELAIVQFQKIRFSEYWLPGDRIKLLVQGSKQELEKAVVDYFFITNASPKPIIASDFTAPITLTKGSDTKKILLVESCTKPLAKTCSSDGESTPSGASYVGLEWSAKGDKWSASPSLLNAGDTSCVVVVSEGPEITPAKSSNRFEWTARVRDIQFKTYRSPEEHAAKKEKQWTDYIQTTVELKGIAVYWFLLLLGSFFVATVLIAEKSQWIAAVGMSSIFRTLLVLFFSASTSEILVDIFVNRRGAGLHPIVWPLLVLHSLFICYLTYRGLTRARSMSSAELKGSDSI